MNASASPSKSQADKAGIVLRAWWRTDDEGEAEKLLQSKEMNEAIVAVQAYRSSFQAPLDKVTVGVRQFVERESDEVVVAQRLKRFPAIARKLGTQTTRLSQMEDIGGCRAILPGGHSEIAGVRRRIRKNWDVIGVDDYVAGPRATGYRAVHIVVRRDGRPIEIQLRTPGQHEWAEAVERASTRLNYRLKYGHGPGELLSYLELAAWAIDHQERDLPGVDEDFLEVFNRTRERALGKYWKA